MTDWGGDGPVALCVHANGFCGALWQLVAEELAGDLRVVAPDLRGHGRSSAPPPGPPTAGASSPPTSWRWSRRSELEVASRVGNSVGGTSVLGAAAAKPGLFGALCLVDPVILARERYADPCREPEPARRGRAPAPARASPRADEASTRTPAGRSSRSGSRVRSTSTPSTASADGPTAASSCGARPRSRPPSSATRPRSTRSRVAPASTTPGPAPPRARLVPAGAVRGARRLAPTLVLVDLPAPHLAPMTHPGARRRADPGGVALGVLTLRGAGLSRPGARGLPSTARGASS